MVSDFFADKKYNQLDWISQAVAPWEYPLIDILSEIPDSIEITSESLFKAANMYWGDINTAELICNEAKKYNVNARDFNCNEWHPIFSLKYEENTIVDIETGTLSSPVFLVKSKPTIDDNDCKIIAANIVRQRLCQLHIDKVNYKRLKEIADLVGLDLKTIKLKNLKYKLIDKLEKIIKDDDWRIRSVHLVDKMAKWIYTYITDNNLSYFVNFTKLKIMTHAGQPIYSIKEEE